MGWQQYSRPLWLSIDNPYILYLKAMTDRMRGLRADFPQSSEFTCFHRLVCLSDTFWDGLDAHLLFAKRWRGWSRGVLRPGLLWLVGGGRASFHRRGPWPRKRLRRSNVVRCGARHRKIPPDSRRVGRYARDRGHRRRPEVE